mmetsp:Transcript_27584/g.92249  ORF Transcript_27584/g.92249 Transcript_27584/m.92249 type:complete len:306 (+) Transcript_27584:673-1590(+)
MQGRASARHSSDFPPRHPWSRRRRRTCAGDSWTPCRRASRTPLLRSRSGRRPPSCTTSTCQRTRAPRRRAMPSPCLWPLCARTRARAPRHSPPRRRRAPSACAWRPQSGTRRSSRATRRAWLRPARCGARHRLCRGGESTRERRRGAVRDECPRPFLAAPRLYIACPSWAHTQCTGLQRTQSSTRGSPHPLHSPDPTHCLMTIGSPSALPLPSRIRGGGRAPPPRRSSEAPIEGPTFGARLAVGAGAPGAYDGSVGPAPGRRAPSSDNSLSPCSRRVDSALQASYGTGRRPHVTRGWLWNCRGHL